MRAALRFALPLALALLAGAADRARAVEAATRSCDAVAADLAAARTAGRLADVVSLVAEAGPPTTACAPKVLFCLGRSAALAHVEAAYAAAGAGRTDEAARLFEAGHRFGEPWPLLVGLGDLASARARAAHDPRLWSEASLDYQKAVVALGAPALCADEPASPDMAAAEQLRRKMLLATLLSRPLAFFHDRCAPCDLQALAQGPIDPAHSRALPITFADNSAGLTPEGVASAQSLAACAAALHWGKLDLSVHTDARGDAAGNLRLADRRAETLRRTLRADGYAGALATDPVGKARPLAIDDREGLSAAEIERANRRVELRAISGAPLTACAAPQSEVR